MFNIMFSFFTTASNRLYLGFERHAGFFMNLDRFIAHEYAGFVWLIIAVLFLFIEIGTPGLFFFVAFALGSCFGSLAAFLHYPLFVQCMIALITSLLIFWGFKKFLFVEHKDAEKTNFEALVGSPGTVTVSIESRSSGRVKVRSEQWTALVADGSGLQKGTNIVVVEVRGNRLIVKGLKNKIEKE